MTAYDKTQNASYGFVAPSIEADADKKVETVFPTAEAQSVSPAATGATAVAINRTTTVIDLGILTGDVPVNATIGADVPVGAMLTVKAKSDTTARTVTFGTGFKAAALAGVISKTKTALFVFDGTQFVGVSSQQID